jgi:chromate transport protein ChrA
MSPTTAVIIAACLIFVLPAITLMIVFARIIRKARPVELHPSPNEDPR